MHAVRIFYSTIPTTNTFPFYLQQREDEKFFAEYEAQRKRCDDEIIDGKIESIGVLVRNPLDSTTLTVTSHSRELASHFKPADYERLKKRKKAADMVMVRKTYHRGTRTDVMESTPKKRTASKNAPSPKPAKRRKRSAASPDAREQSLLTGEQNTDGDGGGGTIRRSVSHRIRDK